MVLSKRERYVGFGAAAVVALLVLDQLVLEPLLTRKAEIDSAIASAQQKLDRAQRLFTSSRRLSRNWEEMVRGGLNKDASNAESQVLHNVRDWAQDAGMTLSSVKPERSEKDKEFVRTTFRATGTGGMSQIGRFLWNIQKAQIPIRVVDLSITSRKDGTDDLSLQLGIATTYFAPQPAEKQAAASIREVQP